MFGARTAADWQLGWLDHIHWPPGFAAARQQPKRSKTEQKQKQEKTTTRKRAKKNQDEQGN